eukprot:TRINITY_DN5214_c1_g1_i2.p1 TRINITY_DN5214_c1_g1~~TRINITY_DN5214_c1_g1_i2.p1  ORF type:complete len:314 (-),score=79.34 TRINITY_DN5214_c1_g1_i2:189-1130(-)
MSHPECTLEVQIDEEADCTLAAADDFLMKINQFTEFVELFITGPSLVVPDGHFTKSFDFLSILSKAFDTSFAFDNMLMLKIKRLCTSLHSPHDCCATLTSSVLLPDVSGLVGALSEVCLVDFVSWQTWIDEIEKRYCYGSDGEICGLARGVRDPLAAHDFVYVSVNDDLTIGSSHRVARVDLPPVDVHADDLIAPLFLVDVARLLRTDVHTFKKIAVGCANKNFDNAECTFNLVVNTSARASSFSHVLEFFDKMIKVKTSFFVGLIVSNYELRLKRPNYKTLMMLLRKQLDKKDNNESVSVSLLLKEIAEFTA